MDAYERLRAAVGDAPLPAALVDLEALERNVDTLVGAAQKAGKTLRVATKSVRCVELLRRIAQRGGPTVRGWMAYAAAEVAFLVERGFDDVLLAYPTAHPHDAALLARASRQAKISVVVDAIEHLDALDAAARSADTVLDVVIDLDVALRLAAGRVHLGVLRSPIRSAHDVTRLARAANARPGLRLLGLMAYEAQVAGLPDHSPSSPRMDAPRRLLKALSRPRVAALRAAAVEALRREGVPHPLVNGGGTGSVSWTASDPSVTEVTAGSGFVASHLFDHYAGLSLSPALFFALQVARVPGDGVVTCAGGGYIASGSAGPDRLPLPWLPRGLRLLDLEGAGEVQTPLRLPPALSLRVGDLVFFRHAKAGELAERFASYLLVRGASAVGAVPTYRGEGGCFG